MALLNETTGSLHYSGEGHLIEGEIEGDPNRTVRPIVCDEDGHLVIDLDASTTTIGTVDQGASGTDPWSVKIDQTGTNNDVDATVTNFPANQNVTVTNAGGASAVNIQDGGNSITVDGIVAISGSVAVTGPLTDTQLRASPVPISGTVTANLGTVDGLALDATLTNGTQQTQVTNFPATVAVTQSTSPWIVSGTVTATPTGTQDVNIVSTIPVPVTDNGGSLTIDGTVSISGSVAVTGPLTDTQLRASPVPVTGTITTSPNVNVHDGTGVSISSTGSSLNVDVTNTVPVTLASTTITGNVTVVQPTGTNLHTVLDSGTLTSITNALPTGTNVIGHVIVDTGSTTVVTGNVTVVQPTGTNLHTVVDSGSITLTGTNNVTIVNGAGAAAVNIQDGGNSITVDGTVAVSNFPATQPISGTVTANQGTANTAANKWPIEIVDSGGVNIATVDAAGDVQVDVNNFPATVAVTQSTSPWVVSGTVTANAGSGNFTVVQPTGTNLHTVLDSGTLTSITNALPSGTNIIGHVIADSGSTTAVTGNVTVVQPTGTNLHTVIDSGTIAATQSGTWTVQPGNTPNTAPWLIEERAPGTLISYSASTLGLVAAATPTDIFTLYGSGTKTVRVTRIEISATQNTAAVRDVLLVKRSSANSGGTSSAPTIVPSDSNNAAATASVLQYTANPASLGTTVGNIRTAKVDIPATNLVGGTDRIIWTFGDRPSQAIVLRGTGQGIAVNLNSVTSASNSFDINVEWTEE